MDYKIVVIFCIFDRKLAQNELWLLMNSFMYEKRDNFFERLILHDTSLLRSIWLYFDDDFSMQNVMNQ